MNNPLKALAVAFSCVLVTGLPGMAMAHALTNQPIGATVGATDYFQVKCSNNGTGNSSRLEVQIKDNTAGASILSAQVQKGLFAANTTDPVGNDDNGDYSPLVSVTGGNGIYDVTVNKTTVAGRSYDLSYHCKTKTNAHSGTTITQKQNQ